ncbi:hypothetical protein BH10CYA1_BH10CYA1_45330 [soil metagenome]
MELKSQKENIELKLEPSSKRTSDLVRPQTASSANLPVLETPARLQARSYKLGGLITAIQMWVDLMCVSATGGVLAFLTTFLMSVLLIGARAFGADLIVVLDTSLFAAVFVGSVWAICACLPVWLGLTFLALQAASGVFVGTFFILSICSMVLIDPTSLGAVDPVFSCIFTLLCTVVPAFALPIYSSVLNASSLRRTVGLLFVDVQTADMRGNKLSFRQAWKRSMVTALEPFLYPLSVALGKNFPDRKKWLESTSKTMLIRSAAKVEQEINKSKETVLVRYRAFQEMEGVFGKDAETVPKVMRKVDVPLRRAYHAIWALSAVTAAVSLPVSMHVPAVMVKKLLFTGQVPDSNMKAVMSALEQFSNTGALLFWFVLAATAFYFILAACRPTHLQFSRAGIRFLSKAMPMFMQDAVCPWSKIDQITLEQVQGKASVADHRIVFKLTDGKKLRMRLGSIGSVAGKEEILRAVERWAPGTPRSTEVITALQPPCDFSYTELWMEALTAPPKREKLKPLIDGALLRANQYTVVNMLGVGGQGTAYVAEDALSAQTVVLKEFLLPVYVDVSARRRALETFEKEARLLKELSHSNVVKLLDYFIEDHRAYLVLEHIDGKSLRSLVNQEGRLGEEQVRQLAKQMCEILAYLHSQSPPVVHRDFTPDNLILRKDGALKLIDFNVAQQSDASSVLSSVVGKPNYLSPEQFRGLPVPQSDIYALGACLQFLLTGEDPVAILSSNPSQTRDDVSQLISNIVQKATEPELSKRFLTASEILTQLEGAVAAEIAMASDGATASEISPQSEK